MLQVGNPCLGEGLTVSGNDSLVFAPDRDPKKVSRCEVTPFDGTIVFLWIIYTSVSRLY